MDATLARSAVSPRVISVSNQKGGVGKTTTVINLAYCLGVLGEKVLIIDIDPQGNAGSGLGIEVQNVRPNIYDMLVGDVDIQDCIIDSGYPNVYMICANDDLSGAQVELVGMPKREFQLKKALSQLTQPFDVILIDTPPSLGLLTLNSLSAANGILIPIQCEYFALEGIAQLLKILKLVRQELNPDLAIDGICLTMFDVRTNLSREVMESVVGHFKEKVFTTIIPRNIKIGEAPSHGKPVGIYMPTSLGALAYSNLAKEFVTKQKKMELTS